MNVVFMLSISPGKLLVVLFARYIGKMPSIEAQSKFFDYWP